MGATKRQHRKLHGRAFTLIEVLIAASATALTATAGAAMIFAVSSASTETRDNRTERAAGHYAADRIGRVVRQSRALGYVSAESLGLWVVDANENDQVDLHETGRVHFDSASGTIAFDYFETTGKTTPVSAVSNTTFTGDASLKTAMNTNDMRTVVLAEGVKTAVFSGSPNKTQTRIVSGELKMDGENASLFHFSASPKAPGDYLFWNETKISGDNRRPRTRRKYFSRWTGFGDVSGAAATANGG